MKKLISAMLALLMLASAAMANPGPPRCAPRLRVPDRDPAYSARRGRPRGPECSVLRATCRLAPAYSVRQDRAPEARRPA